MSVIARIFQNYHRHTHRTNVLVPDSTVSNEDYAKRAVELRHGIISTMEHGNQGCYIEGYNLAQQHNLKFVFGAEAYWVKDRTVPDPTNGHIYIGARNENGRQCINDILSEANLTGFYKRPRIDMPLLLSLPKDDVIVTSACVAFWKYDDVEDIVQALAQHFGKNFFLEVQYHLTEAQRQLNQRILAVRDRLKIPIIMGCDSHYISPRQSQDRDDFLLSKGISYEDEEGWFLDYPDGDEAYQRFCRQGVLTEAQIDEAMSNTNVFLDVESYDSEIFNANLKLPKLPEMKDWPQEQRDEAYECLVWQGWDRYKPSVPEELHRHYESEIQSEIDSVKECHMADYFLIDHEIVKRGKEMGGLLTKTGRGSAVSFITNMLLGFTEVDRIAAKVKMYPDRFMTATRILQAGTLPDIDLNMANPPVFAKAQQEILGEDHAYPMISYHPMKTSKAWKLYAKSQGVSFDEANAVSEQIRRYEEAVKQADEDSKDDIDIMDYISDEYREIFAKSAGYRGITDSWSIAPCGYLLYEGSIRRQIGLVRINNNICCMMDGHWAEDGHFLKNDLLKVSVVNLINMAYERIGMKVPTVNELLAMCPPEDPAWDIYTKGCCMGVNQVERKGTAARCTSYQPRNISELCAFVAAIRPGFKSMYKTFESRKPFEYGVKAFDNILKTEELPFSFCLYQEQEMAALNYAGIPMSECYVAIKDIAKKRAQKVLAYKEKFISGFRKAIIEDEGKSEAEAEEIAEMLWKIIEDSARYSFNASHSYCVSCDSLYIAWVKAHHPLELYETLLKFYDSRGEKDKIAEAKAEARRFFDIKFPPMRFGQDNRAIAAHADNNQITESISTIKGFSATIGKHLWNAAQTPHENFMSLLLDLDQRGVKAKVEPLIKIDYFQQYGNQRELMKMWEIFNYFKQGTAKSLKREAVDGTILANPVRSHATWLKKDGTEAKSYTLTDVMAILSEVERLIRASNLPDINDVIKIRNYCEIMGQSGYISGKEDDRPKLFVKEVFPLKRKSDGRQFGYSILTQSIGSGIESRFTVFNRVYELEPIKKGDVICVLSWEREKGQYFTLKSYRHIRADEDTAA